MKMVLGLREIKEGTLDSLTSRACNIRKQGHFRFFSSCTRGKVMMKKWYLGGLKMAHLQFFRVNLTENENSFGRCNKNAESKKKLVKIICNYWLTCCEQRNSWEKSIKLWLYYDLQCTGIILVFSRSNYALVKSFVLLAKVTLLWRFYDVVLTVLCIRFMLG